MYKGGKKVLAKKSHINLVDLAGSEWASTVGNDSVRWEEGSNINKSLSFLGKCINILADKAAGKKAVEVKTMYSTALKSAPAYRKDRRLFLAQLLKDFWLLISECPGLLGKFGTNSI